MFGKKKPQVEYYDKENVKPVIRASICTGEQVAGFKNIHTGKFEEIMLIRDERDKDVFLSRYGISAGEITKEY
ncbi:MAG: aspartate dehydrogenase [Lachnospiraceae bacterium]|nr:aspartate dehydrogenase [Lachnospiraceae bacterium]